LPAQLLQHGLSLRVLYECGIGACDLSACGCSCGELLASGYDVRSLWDGGFTVQQLQAAGCSSQQLQAAELPAAALWDSGLFSAGDMKAAGYSCEQLQQLGWRESECRLSQIVQLQTAAGAPINSWVVFGEVIGVHIDKSLLKDGIYDTATAQHIARGGGPADYFSIGPDQLFKMVRPRQ
jgi:hypothetical protein